MSIVPHRIAPRIVFFEEETEVIGVEHLCAVLQVCQGQPLISVVISGQGVAITDHDGGTIIDDVINNFFGNL